MRFLLFGRKRARVGQVRGGGQLSLVGLLQTISAEGLLSVKSILLRVVRLLGDLKSISGFLRSVRRRSREL